MKNEFFSILGVLIISGFLMVGCDNDTTSQTTKFEGKWVATWSNESNGTGTFTFTDTNVTYEKTAGTSNSYISNLSGIFSFNDTEITFTFTKPDNQTWVKGYTLVGDTLTLEQGTGGDYGEFKK
jgi:hypothetical protein